MAPGGDGEGLGPDDDARRRRRDLGGQALSEASPAHPERSPGRPAFYALRSGGWRDYWTLLHPPYTLWHLSNVALGAAAAPAVDWRPLAATLLAFFLGVGVTAHALDEVAGRPLRTRISDRVLWTLAWTGLAGAVALGVLGAARVSWWLLAFVAFGGFIVVAYNLELFGGRLHSSVWFALAWGGFPALTAYFAQAATVRLEGILVAAGCAALAAAQRRLSTPVRTLRRRARSVEGSVTLSDGRRIPLDEETLRRIPEGALRMLSAAVALLAGGLVAARLLA
ncbi:MAG TPA: hypothetical protein VHL78_08705 [Actinomycetota bacterium]|nr:hypothetical protein [Actinomycetota bacterium]